MPDYFYRLTIIHKVNTAINFVALTFLGSAQSTGNSVLLEDMSTVVVHLAVAPGG